jgi:purine catabolism regulator
MAVTVRRLLDEPLGLRLRSGEAGLDRVLSWVTVSELEDPTPYLEGGELVLLTGIGFAFDGPAAAAYVRRLVAREVAAVGFGVGIRYDDVPPSLVEASRAGDLPLIEVDRPTPFVAVSRAVAALLGAEAADRARRRLDGMRALTADVARGGDPVVAVRRLAALVAGSVVLFGARGEVLVHSGGADVLAAAAVVERIRGRGTKVSASAGQGGGRIVAVPLGVGARATGYLAVCGPADREVDQQFVAFAAALLTLDRERARGVATTTRWARAVALAHALGLAHERPAAPPSVAGPLADPEAMVRVVVLRAVLAQDLLSAVDDEDRVLALDRPGEQGADACVVVVVGVDDVDDVLRVIDTAAATRGRRGGASAPVAAGEVAAALPIAQSLAERSSGGVLRAEEAPATLVAMLGEPAAVAFARAVLEPMQALDDGERQVLEQTLTTWLRTNGEVGAAAGRLGVHRHTLRQRLRRAAQVLARDLDDPQTRVDLWVALGSSRNV